MENETVQSRAPNVDDNDPLAQVRLVRRCLQCGDIMFVTPVIKCECCHTTLPLRSYVYRKYGSYYAECIDLSLIGCGSTEESAVIDLQVQMYSYIKTAFDGDVKGLVPRPSPLMNRLHYHLSRLKSRLGRRHNHAVNVIHDLGVCAISHN